MATALAHVGAVVMNQAAAMARLRKRRSGWRSLRRALYAQGRDAYVLLLESRASLMLFVTIVAAGAIVFYLTNLGATHPLSFSQALYGTFGLIFFETILEYPDAWYLQLLFFIIPIVGLAAVADGVLRFGAALFNKQSRGQKWQIAMASTYRNHIVVCGTGKVGYRVILELLKYNREIVAVEHDPNCPFLDNVQDLGVPLIMADARRPETLIKAGVPYADAIIPAATDELTNLDVALHARELNPGIKVVLRMFDPDLARRVESGFGIHTAFSTSAISAPIFATAAMRVNVKHSFYVGDTLLNVSEIVVAPASQLSGWTIDRLERELDLSVVYYQGKDERGRDVSDLHPEPTRRLDPGDKLLVLAALPTLQKLNAMNPRP